MAHEPRRPGVASPRQELSRKESLVSYDDGWAALNLDAPARVPRTEYSAQRHWDLISQVTGLNVSAESDTDTRSAAQKAFFRAWNYDLHWSVRISSKAFGDIRTSMGHAAYDAGGSDYNSDTSQLFAQPEDALAFDPEAGIPKPSHREMVTMFEDHYRSRCAIDPDAVNMTGVYITCVSGLIDLLGWETLLMAAGIDREAFGRLVNRYADWVADYFRALADADVPVVMVHDDIVWTEGPFLPPPWYRTYVFPNLKRLIAPLKESGKKVLFTSDGNYTMFLDDVVDCGVDGLVMEPLTDLAVAAEKFGRTHALIGNVDTRVLLSGDRAAIRAEVQRCMAIGKDCPGFFLAVGNHIPANTPVDAAMYYNQVYEELCGR